MSTPAGPGDDGDELPVDAARIDPTSPPTAAHDDTGLELAAMIARAAQGRRPARPRPAPSSSREPRPDAPTYTGAGPDDRDPQPLGQVVGRVVDERGWQTHVSVHVLLGRWASIVGEGVAQHSQPESFSDGVLVVRADSTAWATQLRLMASTIMAAMNRETGQGTVTRVQVLGPTAPSWKHGTWSVSDGRGPRDTYG